MLFLIYNSIIAGIKQHLPSDRGADPTEQVLLLLLLLLLLVSLLSLVFVLLLLLLLLLVLLGAGPTEHGQDIYLQHVHV